MEKLSLNQKEVGEVNKFKKMYVSFFFTFLASAYFPDPQ